MNRKSILIALVVCSFALTAVVAQATPINLTAAPASASAEFDASPWGYPYPGYYNAAQAFDGNLGPDGPKDGTNCGHRWVPGGTPAWIMVDLGADYSLNNVKISWESGYSTNYTLGIRSSLDGPSGAYATIATIVTRSGTVGHGNTSGTWTYDETFDFTTGSVTLTTGAAASKSANLGATGRYLMLNSTSGGSVVWEIQVDGTVIPEPSTLVLLAAGLVGLLCYAWRKRR